MKITRRSLLSGIERTKDLPITKKQLADYYENDLDLQKAFPNLTESQREFIKSGIIVSEWIDYLMDGNVLGDC